MRKNKGILTLSILFSIFLQAQVFRQMEESIVIGTKIKMKSEILNEESDCGDLYLELLQKGKHF